MFANSTLRNTDGDEQSIGKVGVINILRSKGFSNRICSKSLILSDRGSLSVPVYSSFSTAVNSV